MNGHPFSDQQGISPRARRRGSILITTVVMLVVAGIAILAVIQLTTQNVRDVARSEARLQSFYVAEAGAQHVIHWFNRPNESPDPPYFSPDETGNYLDAAGNSIITESLEIEAPHLPRIITGDRTTERGQVIRLFVEPPWDEDPPGTVARVTSIGEAGQSRVDSTVEIRLIDNRVPAITSPGAVISRHGATSGGLFQVNWGEIWAAHNLILPHPLRQKFPNQTDDPWFAARTEQHLIRHGESGIRYADGRVDGAFTSTPIEPTAPNYHIPFLEDTLAPQNNNYRDYENLHQHVTDLAWPNYDYETIKLLAQYHDFPIYRTTSDGRLITGEDPATGAPIIQTFEEVFNRKDGIHPNDVIPEEAPPVYFIDTIDGNPPAEDGSNLAEIRVSGQGPFFYGNFFVAADMHLAGAGNSPTLGDPIRPDGSIGRSINNLRLYGMFYSYGQAELQGSGDIYGSFHAEQGFSGGGNWEIFYDIQMQNENRVRIGSNLRAQLWNSY